MLDCVEAIGEAGVAVETLRVSGKLTRLAGLVQLLADLGRRPVQVASNEETGLAGIARLAMTALAGGREPLELTAGTRRTVIATSSVTSTTSMATSSRGTSPRRIDSAVAVCSPPTTGVPVPGAQLGSRQSISNVT